MSDQNNKSTLIIVAVVALLALVGAGAYFSLAGKKASEPAPVETATTEEEMAPAVPEGPIVEGEVPPQPETPQNVVVETKKLDIPQTEETAAADAPATPEAAPVASTPDVEAMMAPRFIGSPTAPIKITEYSSLTCSHCAHFHKETFAAFKTKFVDTGKVQLSFKEFPLNPPALDASQILRCMPEDKFVSFMSLLFEQQDNWAYKPEYKDVLRQNAKLAGMSDEQFDACLANEGLKNRIVADMKAASDKYKIQSTPSFIINDGAKAVVGSVPLESFEKAIEEVETGKVTPDAPAAEPAAHDDHAH